MAYDIEHWSEDEDFNQELLLDLVAFLPMIGSIKYVKNADSVGDIVMHLDDIIDESRTIIKNSDEVGGALKSAVKNGGDWVRLSKSKISHILNNHHVDTFAKQLENLPDAQLEVKLANKSFFNPKWTSDEVIEAATYAYNDALKAGVTSGTRTIEYLGEKITIAFDANGTLKTAYGSYKYTVDEFLALIGGKG